MNFISELQSLQPELQRMAQRRAHTGFYFAVRDGRPWEIEVSPTTPDAFVRVALKAGRLLEQVPELVTRISGEALAEPDPAKRWFRLLLDFHSGMISWRGEGYPAFRVDPKSVGPRRDGRFCRAAEYSLTLIERLALWWEMTEVGATGGPVPGKRPPPKRGSRTRKIERLTNEMIAYLHAARNHAHSSRDLSGTAQLLPRPSQKHLAGLTQLTACDVSRCLSDPSARELQLLWRTALNLDEVLAWRSPNPKREAG